MAERIKSIKVKLLKFGDIINSKDGSKHNTIWQWYLSDNNNGKYMITCTEGVSYPIKNGKITIDFYRMTENSRSVFPTCEATFSIEELKSMVIGEYISLNDVVRRHTRVDRNYEDAIYYMESNKFNVYKIEEKKDVQCVGV